MDSVAVAGRTDTRVAGPLATVRPWSETEFAGAAGPWNALLERSAANPLFMSWEW